MAASAEIGGSRMGISMAGGDRIGLASSRHVSRAVPLAGGALRSSSSARRGPVVRSEVLIERDRVRFAEINGAANLEKKNASYGLQLGDDKSREMEVLPNPRRKTKIVCTIGPSTSSREMIWKLAEAGMNVARLNMSHGDHKSHQKTIDLVREYNAQHKENVIAIMLDTKGPEVRSGDVAQPVLLTEGQEFNFTIQRGDNTENTVSVNYDDFVNDVDVGDIILVDGGMMSLSVKAKTVDTVKCVVVDGGELKSRRHLNIRGKSATLPSITGNGGSW